MKFNLLLLALLFVSCAHDPVIPASPEISFKDQVQPIILSNCATAGCHSSSSQELPGLTNYDEVVSLVQPGNAYKSDLYNVITALSSWKMMPPQGPLSEDQLRNIYVWINQGAKNN